MIPNLTPQNRTRYIILAIIAGCLLVIGILVLFMRPQPTPSPAPVADTPQTTPTSPPGTSSDSETPTNTTLLPTETDTHGYGFDVPTGYTVAHSATAQSERWTVTTLPTADMETPLPEMTIQRLPYAIALSAETNAEIISSTRLTINGLSGTKYLLEEVENAECPTYEFIVEEQTYRFRLHECLDSRIFEQVVETFRKKTSSPPTLPPAAESDPQNGSFTLRIGETATMTDGANVTLVQINDSRCKPDVQCIWAGELAAEVRYSDSSGVITLRLGQITKSCDHGLRLITITKTTATFSKGEACGAE